MHIMAINFTKKMLETDIETMNNSSRENFSDLQ